MVTLAAAQRGKSGAATLLHNPSRELANKGNTIRNPQKDLDLRISDDPGRYLCDFIYYSSLSQLYKEQRPRKVIFFHVPADATEAAVARGRELAVNLIRSLVESEEAAKKRRKEKPDDGGEL